MNGFDILSFSDIVSCFVFGSVGGIITCFLLFIFGYAINALLKITQGNSPMD